MNDVEQRFVVHGFVFEDREGRLSSHEPWNRGIFDRTQRKRAQNLFVARCGKSRDRAPVRPIGTLVTTRVVDRRWVDPALEDALENGVERLLLQPALVENQITKRRNVALVKSEGVAQGNRPIVERFVVNQREECGRALSIFAVPVEQPRPVHRARRSAGAGDHNVPRFSCSRSIETKSALKLPFPNDKLPLRWMISKKSV